MDFTFFISITSLKKWYEEIERGGEAQRERLKDEEIGRGGDEESGRAGDEEIGKISISLFSLLPSPFFRRTSVTSVTQSVAEPSSF
ncbi:hypothetical protein [Microcoleus sp. BROC3]|uniref:hypothetical protein n=1 Tax=Microcoleus sp. BROC3 TaxID=3055323 RepID=UPI002FD242C3